MIPAGAPLPRLCLRADAEARIGAGHAMRLASLGEAWTAGGGRAVLWGRVELPFVAERLAGAGVEVADAPPADGGCVLVVDSYDEAVRATCAARPARLRVLVDDLGCPVPSGYGMVWNPNAYGDAALYPGFAGEVLGGPAAVPVRPGLPAWSGAGSPTVGAMLGGGNPGPVLGEAMRIVAEALGPQGLTGVGEWVRPPATRADASGPWTSLSRCGALVTAAGSSVWEAAAVGIPAVVVRTAYNQDRIVRWARDAGVPAVDALGADDAAALAAEILDALGRAAPLPPIDPGAGRVARRLQAAAAVRISIREAGGEDTRALWRWANDPETRAASFGRDPIPWGEHLRWLDGVLASPAHAVLIALDGRDPAGSVRFDTADGWETARLSYVVAPEARGLGLSIPMVAAAVEWVRHRHPGVRVRADVMHTNPRSLRVFRRLGWSEGAAGDGVSRFHAPGEA